MSSSLLPQVLYAQDKASVFLTVNLSDVVDPKIETTATSINFHCTRNGTDYSFNIELFDLVKENGWVINHSNRSTAIIAEKENKEAKFWPRLQKAAGKLTFVKTDFSKYKDEDEDEDEVVADPQSGMNSQLASMMSGMPGMGGMGGMPGMGGMGGMGGMDPDAMKKMMADAPNDTVFQTNKALDSDDEEEDLEKMPALQNA